MEGEQVRSAARARDGSDGESASLGASELEFQPTDTDRISATLRLQQLLGNFAVQRLIQRAPHYVQRFTGPEHNTLGNATGIRINLGNGVVLD